MKTLEEHLTNTIYTYLSEVASANNTILESLDLFTHKVSPVVVKTVYLHDNEVISLNESDKEACGAAQDYPVNNETNPTTLKQTVRYQVSEQTTQNFSETHEFDFGTSFKVTSRAEILGLGGSIEGDINRGLKDGQTREQTEQKTHTQELEAVVEVPPFSRATCRIQPYRLTQTHAFKADFILRGSVAFCFKDKKLSYDIKTRQCHKITKSVAMQYISIHSLFSLLSQQGMLASIRATIEIKDDEVWLKAVGGKRQTPVFRLESRILDIKSMNGSLVSPPSLTLPAAGGIYFKGNVAEEGYYKGVNVKASSAAEALKLLTDPTLAKHIEEDGARGLKAMSQTVVTANSVVDKDYKRKLNYQGPEYDIRHPEPLNNKTDNSVPAALNTLSDTTQHSQRQQMAFMLPCIGFFARYPKTTGWVTGGLAYCFYHLFTQLMNDRSPTSFEIMKVSPLIILAAAAGWVAGKHIQDTQGMGVKLKRT